MYTIDIKGKFYKTNTKLAILYGTNVGKLRNIETTRNKIRVIEMRVLRWKFGKTRRGRIRTEHIHDLTKVVPTRMSGLK